MFALGIMGRVGVDCAGGRLFAVGVALLVWAGVGAAGGMDWQIERVDDSSIWVSDKVGIAVTADGRPHIAHTMHLSELVRYAYQSGGGWALESVGEWPAAWAVSIALDADENPAVAFQQWESSSLIFARRSAGEWQYEEVGLMERDSPCELKFDAQGVPHIAYSGTDSPWPLRHAWRPADEWLSEVADPTAVSGYDTALFIDEAGHLHINHWANPTGSAVQKYTVWDGERWSSTVVDMPVGKCNVVHSGIAVDAAGTPHMVWQTHTCELPGAQRYGVLTPDGWAVTTIDKAFSAFSASCSLVLDRTGAPHIVYGTKGQIVGGESQLRYAHRDAAGQWVIEVIDDSGDAGERNAIAIDAQGYLHVAYYAGFGGQMGEIRYARSLEPVGAVLGDLNCDGSVDAFDIDAFVLALTDAAAYAALYPDCDRMLADCSGDGQVDAFDIDPFVDLLTGG